jgi:hypothetical protein
MAQLVTQIDGRMLGQPFSKSVKPCSLWVRHTAQHRANAPWINPEADWVSGQVRVLNSHRKGENTMELLAGSIQPPRRF